jgi:hypothetical protein
LIGAGIAYSLVSPGSVRTATTTVDQTTTQTVTNISTTTVTINSTQEVMSAFAAHLRGIESRNVTALVAQYESNATLDLVCSPNGLGGVYTGAYNINILYPVMFNSPGINFTDFSPGVFANVKGETTVNSTFNAQGSESGPTITAFSGGANLTESWTSSVRLGASYVNVGNSWLISSETWIFGDINTVSNTCG